MFFDDRLATVLRQRGDSDAGARTQYRQLLDILGNRKFASQDQRSQSMVAAAWLRMDALAARIPMQERARMVRERGWRLRTADLTAHLAGSDPEVASAALNRAELSEEDWNALIPRLPVRARGFLRHRSDLPGKAETLLERLGVYDRGLPSPEGSASNDVLARADDPASEPLNLTDPDDTVPGHESEPITARYRGNEDDKATPGNDETETGRSEISALVERIAQYRRTRDIEAAEGELAPRLPLDDDIAANDRKIAAFGFAADAGGRIEWAENEVAPGVIGTRLVAPRMIGSDEPPGALERAFTRRQPINRAEVELSGASAIAGAWIVDARPRFTEDGNFAGYVGRFRRPASDLDGAHGPAAREADRIRQLLHELRTPVTAIQGYAEVIQQQLFGPAPHEYRAMAASIAADSALILSGFGELDRLARLEAGLTEMEAGEADLADIARRIVAQLASVLAPRLAGIDLEIEGDESITCDLDDEDAEALMWRILATCGGGCASGETLRCTISRDHAMARMSCEVPAQLVGEDDIFAADAKPIAGNINAGVFGAGFALRLARAEARAAGGGLTHDGERVTLLLPLLTGAQSLPNQDETGGMHDQG